MKLHSSLIPFVLIAGLIGAPVSGMAVESAPAKGSKKAKPYPLKVCLIADETLDADPSMKSFAFVHEGQEIKLCCKSCQKDFKKEPAKYLKKMKELVAKEAAKSTK